MRSGSAVTCPVFVYPKGAPEKAAYFGHGMETYQTQLKPFWVSEVSTKSGGSVDVMQKAADYVRGAFNKPGRIGLELAFAPADSVATLRKTIPDARDQGCTVRARAIAACARRRRNWKSSGLRPSW